MLFRLIRLSVPFIWFGAVCAISFMEAPLKFFAPNMTVELGLGIGRLVFHALNYVEIVLALLFLLSLIVTRASGRWSAAILPAIVFTILFLQSVWLLPALDARTEALLSGSPPSSSHLHLAYVAAELIKVAVLLAIGILELKPLLRKEV